MHSMKNNENESHPSYSRCPIQDAALIQLVEAASVLTPFVICQSTGLFSVMKRDGF